MEVRSVVKSEPKYPEMKDISKSKLKNAIPKTWRKLGISVMVFGLIMRNSNKVNAIDGIISSGLVPDPVPDKKIIICNKISEYVFYVTIISLVISIISIIKFIINRFKGKKNENSNELDKSYKRIKIIFIISAVVLELSLLVRFILEKIIANL